MENEVRKKRILSGIQPSGDLTLGSATSIHSAP